MIEHIPEHHHAALHLLAGTGEFGMIKLGHGAVAMDQGKQHVGDCIGAETVAKGQVIDGP
ncbi:hypothetical protein CCP4SC76_5280004 [Gammaproteobacteria bacterium]